MSMAASPQSSKPFNGAVVVMGVSSCGKTTLGEALAQALGAHFVEGDKLHPPENIKKMSTGQPLNDQDRWPWLTKVGETLQGTQGIIASCSSLKKTYRDLVRATAGRPVHFIHLHGSRELLAARIAARKNHFMPPTLLDSQLATLEMPLASEPHLTLAIDETLETQVEKSLAYLLHGV
jgi:gluconokinase